MAFSSSVQYDFPPHSISTTCLQLGKRNEKLLVTGGDDRRINLWSIGHKAPTSLLSLAGHASAITCVGFDNDEQYVVAGSTSGTIKLWDLTHQKVVRTFLAHRIAVDVVQYHPFGDYFASSSEREVKVWDIRRKGCIQAFQESQVRPLLFSPDGKWVLTASPLYTQAKLWELSTGKLLHTFQHPAPVHQIVFHPEELILGSVLVDGSVWFWDMDTFTCISNSSFGHSSKASKFLLFHHAGQHALFLSKDQCDVYQWEPIRSLDTIDLQWHAASSIRDANITSTNQLIAASFSEVMVSIFQLDLSSLAPFRTEKIPFSGSESMLSTSLSSPSVSLPSKSLSMPSSLYSSTSSLSHLPLLPPIMSSSSSSLFKNGIDDEATSNSVDDDASTVSLHSQISLVSSTDNNGSSADTTSISSSDKKKNVSEFLSPGEIPPFSIETSINSVTQSNSSSILNSTTTCSTGSVTTSTLESKLPPTISQTVVNSSTSSLSKHLSSVSLESPSVSNDSLNNTLTPHTRKPSSSLSTSAIIATLSTPLSDLPSPSSPLSYSHPSTTTILPASDSLTIPPPITKKDLSQNFPTSTSVIQPSASLPLAPISVSTQITPTIPIPPVTTGTSPMTPPHSPFIPCSGRMPLYLDLSSIIRGSSVTLDLRPNGSPSSFSEYHGLVLTILTQRLHVLKAMQQRWILPSPKAALTYANDTRQHAIYIDSLRILRSVPQAMTLDTCVIILPWLTELLFGSLEDYLITSCTVVKLILRHFSTLITTTLQAPPSVGIDFSREERIEKCKKCRKELISIQQILQELSHTPGSIGHLIRDTLVAFPDSL